MTYLQDTHTAFNDGPRPIGLSACTYLHNYRYVAEDVLLADKFRSLIERCPLFTEDDLNKLRGFMTSRLSAGDGLPVLRRIEESNYMPIKKLMDHVGNVIRGKPEYVLLDEQLVAYDKVLSAAKQGSTTPGRRP
jgi:hypothetical protein